jgi:hypothetical protein
MRKLVVVMFAALLVLPFTAMARAQVSVGIGVGPAVVADPYAYDNYDYDYDNGYYDYDYDYGPPVCQWGYYPYYPYACAPYGYYGPQWFVSGLFIGAGPWYGWGWRHTGWYGGRYWGGSRYWYGGHRYAYRDG